MSKKDTLMVYVCAVLMENALSEAEDIAVPGIYRVTLDPALTADVAGAALDAFFAKVPILDMDDFAYQVLDVEGHPLGEQQDYDSCSYHGDCHVERVSDLLARCPWGALTPIVANTHRETVLHAT